MNPGVTRTWGDSMSSWSVKIPSRLPVVYEDTSNRNQREMDSLETNLRYGSDARQKLDRDRSRTYEATVLIICKEEEVREAHVLAVTQLSQLISVGERWRLTLGLERWSLVGWLHAGTSRAESTASAP